MRRSTALAAALFSLFCAAAALYAAPGRQMTHSEFMEKLSDMLESVPPPPAVTEAEVIELEDGDPKTYIFIRGAQAHPPAPVNFGGDGRLALTRNDSGEQATAVYRNKDGTYDQGELGKITRLLRCRLTGKETPVSIKLVEILDAVEDKFGGRGLIVLSGYRTPTLNRQLPGAARWSMHMLGWAADIRVPGYGPDKVAAYARKLRAGGVGYYPDAAFTHLDSGRPRHWAVRRPAKAPAP
ncbi:MAG: DUF882 domain-containing protein [Elusimicrobiota bacterium]